MSEFQLVNLADLALVGDPIPMPPEFANLSEQVVSDFSAHIDPPPVGYAGRGLWPLVVSSPTFDPATEADTGVPDLASRTVDTQAGVVRAVSVKRALTPEEIAARNPVPSSVSAAQACLILEDDGLLAQVETIVAAMPKVVQIWFARANTWERFNPYVMGIGLELDLTDEALDDKFRRAARRL